MNKLRYFVITGLVLSMSTTAFAINREVDISMLGVGGARISGSPVDSAALQTVRQVIGHAVADGVVDKLVAIGRKGAYEACAKAAPLAKTRELNALVRQLRSITPNPATVYSVRLTARCVISFPCPVC